MFCEVQVIGLIEVGPAANWLPSDQGVLEDLFHAVQGSHESLPSSARITTLNRSRKEAGNDTGPYPIVHANLQQLEDDLHVTYQQLRERLVSVSVS